MTRTALTMILLVAVTRAQVATTLGTVETFSQLRGSTPASVYGSPQFQYDKLRQGTAEYARIILLSSGRLAIGDSSGSDLRIGPTKLEFQTSPGFQISSVSFPAARFKQFRFDPKPFKVLSPTRDEPVRFRFKVRASPDLVPGDYVLKAKLSYQLIGDEGISAVQQLDVELPVKVAEHSAKVETGDLSVAGIRGITPADWAAIILLAPLSIPVSLFMAIIGWDGC